MAGRWAKVHLDVLEELAPNMTAVAVYAYLCAHANRAGESWPENESISIDLDVSTRTVARAVAFLLDAEVIVPADPGRFTIPALSTPTGG